MILPKLSAAILSMALLGSAYAASSLDPDISIDQWVLMSGATNGAADAMGVCDEDLDKHRNTARAHLTRYASEHGARIEQFDAMFEQGMIEGKKLVTDRSNLTSAKGERLLTGFHRDKSIDYQIVKNALDT
ncbi:hypothetical protein LSG25_11050 [Paralcaligenes sp. KSB-10]|uniref:hypothetical protein n=1 Tax=Paralcaligenes sp. KSB-10 TaxID=2901142 RepID=UPI001E4CB9CB|nr:hypothetical protein [Paralcaligenes sp. KSB-10]UHL62624.1 hypothetical protein LSG25_11050 [Paralcaligenes sp. KSB-10]